MQPEVIALLLPEQTAHRDSPNSQVTAITRDAEGTMEVRQLRLDRQLMRRARVAGRFNTGKPILDPFTREVVGYEIEPLAVSSA
jgi:hypothetical protein